MQTFPKHLSRADAETAIEVAKSAGCLDTPQTPRKPKAHLVKTDRERALFQILDQGLGRTEMADRAGITQSFIRQYFVKHPEQKMRWEIAYRRERTARYRKKFLSVMRANPGLSTKQLSLVSDSGYKWLYVNDREWLGGVMPSMWGKRTLSSV